MELHVVEHPAAEPGAPLVVLVHGSMDRSTSFAKLVRRLGDLHVVRYDRRGYGNSVAAGPADLDGHTGDLVDLLAGRPAVLVGHSLGGVVALAAAARAPGLVRAVLAYEAPMPWLPWWSERSAGSVVMDDVDPAEAAERFMRRMIGDDRWARLPPSTRLQRRAEGPALVRELRSVRTGNRPYDLGAVKVPVVAACGSRSKPHHREAAHELGRTAVDGELVEVDGADHGVHLTHSEVFADLVRHTVGRAGP